MAETLNFTGQVNSSLAFTGDGTASQIIATGSVATKGDKGDVGPGVPTGGAANQALVKVSSTSFDSSWQNIANSVAGRTGAITLAESDITSLVSDLAGKAPLASPALTGTPTAPTASLGTNTTQVATTAYTFAQAAAAAASALAIYTPPVATFTTNGSLKQLYYNIRDFGAVGNGSTDDSAAINNAIIAANAGGGGIVYVPPGTFVVTGATITPLSNVTIMGEGVASVIQNTTGANSGHIFQNQSASFSDFTFDNITLVGNQTNSGTTTAIYLDGNLDPDVVGAPVITNIILRNVIFRNCASLPIRLFGITGRTYVTGCEFTHNADAGFGWSQEVIFIGNHSYQSQDNGFSISRGNKKVICIGNTIENPTFWGIWMSGFANEVGPTELVCNSNVVINSPSSGISLKGSPSFGSISGNYIDQGHNRPTNSDIDCIQIYGDSSTQFANALTVSGNTLLNGARAGITLSNASNVLVSNNMIINPGTQYKADGVTAIASSDITTNIGIFTVHNGTYSNVLIDGNYVIDNRTTPYCNWDYQTVDTPGVAYGINYSTGMINPSNLDLSITQASNSKPIFNMKSAIVHKRVTVSDNAYTVLASDYIVAYIALTTGHTVTLPDPTTVPGQTVIIKDETGTAGTNNITVTVVSSGTIDGVSSVKITLNYGVMQLYSNGTSWSTQSGAYGSVFTGGLLNINNSSTGTGVESQLLLTSGTATSNIGGVSSTRSDTSNSSVTALRTLANSSLTADGTNALFYLQGLPSNTRGFIGINAGMAFQRTTVSDAAYTVLTQDYIVAYVALTGAHTVTLPTAPTTGQTHIIKDEVGLCATFNLTVKGPTGVTIDGAANQIINVNYGAMRLYFDGTNWHVTGGIYNTSQGGSVYTAGTGLTLTGSAFSLTNPVSVANGGTGSATQNFVDLTATQSIAGSKTFSTSLTASAAFAATQSVRFGTSTITTSTTLSTSSLYYIVCNPVATINLTLPSTTTAAFSFAIVNISAFAVTIVATVNGITNPVLGAYQSMTVFSTTTSGTWYGLSGTNYASNTNPLTTLTYNNGSSSLYWLNSFAQTANFNSTASIGGGTAGVLTHIGKILTAASTTTQAGLNLPSGTAPTSPNAGDVWFASSSFSHYNGSITQTFVDQQSTQTIAGNKTLSGTTTLAQIETSEFKPNDHSFIAWAYDPFLCATQTVTTGGLLYCVKIPIPVATNITNLWLGINGPGVTLTSGQNFAGLYSSAGALLASSADQSTAWLSSGLIQMALTGAPIAVSAGYVYVCWYSVGTTKPSFMRGNAIQAAVSNANLSAANSRWATANGSLTTALPGTIGTMTATNQTYWAAVS
jgi:hypothetical protein